MTKFNRIYYTIFVIILIGAFVITANEYIRDSKRLKEIDQMKYTVEREIKTIKTKTETFVLVDDIRYLLDNNKIYPVTMMSDGNTYISTFEIKDTIYNEYKRIKYEKDKMQILKAEGYSKQELESINKLRGSLYYDTHYQLLKIMAILIILTFFAVTDIIFADDKDKYIKTLKRANIFIIVSLITYLIYNVSR